MSRPAMGRPGVRGGTIRDANGAPFSQRDDETFDDFIERCVVAVSSHINAPLPRPPELAEAPPTLETLRALGLPDQRLVYFAQCMTSPGPIKVGLASDVARRLGEVQVGCPYPIELMGTLPGGRAGEALLHRVFAAFKIHGEWFWPDRIVVHAIRTLLREQKKARAA
jgi:hypothetical protein